MEEASAVFLCQQILDGALEQGCTDVHVSVSGGRLEVKFRLDGLLVPYLASESPVGPALVRRIKALANMDVAESRLPQDGAFHWEGKETCDVRVSTLPLIHGECMVLRLLAGTDRYDFRQLGMDELQVRQLSHMLNGAGGLMVVAGPTGSGKTTTLYAIMRWLAERGRHVVSLEDPVERPIPELHQFQIREKIGFTFASALKAVLRQDPDAIAIGEVRDEETARVMLRAALTGHLVLATAHAADLIGVAERLSEFGLARSLIADVLIGAVVQTWLDEVCYRCQGRGCEACRSGVLRRVPRFTVHRMTQALRHAIASGSTWHDMHASPRDQRIREEPLEHAGT
ncbi:GspE/PulE family protein [Alicyclobacillus kakegawensis]|uniref:GspE/PulE family protein n=1 Tax=Alicyclobacillus kakegawensis TaxID=392012 RepID=UPI0008359CB6|nr:ATPase, T2SS/T4P/T4SS family [Alicyclobacillus kakegawensis]